MIQTADELSLETRTIHLAIHVYDRCQNPHVLTPAACLTLACKWEQDDSLGVGRLVVECISEHLDKPVSMQEIKVVEEMLILYYPLKLWSPSMRLLSDHLRSCMIAMEVNPLSPVGQRAKLGILHAAMRWDTTSLFYQRWAVAALALAMRAHTYNWMWWTKCGWEFDPIWVAHAVYALYDSQCYRCVRYVYGYDLSVKALEIEGGSDVKAIRWPRQARRLVWE